MGRAVRPIAVGVRVKPRFHQRLQELGHGRLRDPVCDRRHPEHPDPIAMRLGNHDRSHRRREPGPRTHPIPDLEEVVLKILLERVEILLINAGSALVGLDLPPRLPHQQLGNRKRLVLQPCHASSLPPRTSRPRLFDSTSPMSRPLRSTTTPASSGFTATTSRSASERLNRYSMPPVAAVGSLPLAARRTDPQARTAALEHSLSHVPVQEPQTRLAPPLRRTPPGQQRGQPPGSSRERRRSPVSMPSDSNFDASTTTPDPQPAEPDASGTPSWSPPDRIKPSLLRIAHHDGLQPTQHRVV